MAADGMRLRGIGIGEKVSVSACVRDQRAALFHTQSRTTTYHVRWEEVAVAFDSGVENDDIGESGESVPLGFNK